MIVVIFVLLVVFVLLPSAALGAFVGGILTAHGQTKDASSRKEQG